MSCIHLEGNICTRYKMICNVEPRSICYFYEDESTKETPVKYCKFCFNARIYKPTEEELMNPFNIELTDENDSSSCGVGHCSKDTRFMITSGYGAPLRIEVDHWNDSAKEWHTVGRYYPKYCPECGRLLDEYGDNNYNAYWRK